MPHRTVPRARRVPFVLLLVLVLGSASPSAFAHAVLAPANASASGAVAYTSSTSTVRVAPARPRIVAGYSFHARQRMEERGIPEWHVRAVIEGPDPGIFQDHNDTWIVTDGVLVVVINARGFIVTGFPGDG